MNRPPTGPGTAHLSCTDIAKELGRCAPAAVARWCRANRFPGAFCLPGALGWRIPRSSWERYKKEHRVAAIEAAKNGEVAK